MRGDKAYLDICKICLLHVLKAVILAEESFPVGGLRAKGQQGQLVGMGNAEVSG